MPGVLVVTAFRAGGEPAARVTWTHDVDREPESVIVVSSLDDLVGHVVAWWIAHWNQNPGSIGP
jgi:hypothetical protein